MQHDPQPTPDVDARQARLTQLLALAFGHALNDGYVNFIAPLWPQVKAVFALNNSQIGVITLWWGLTTNFGQPVLGYITDRWRPPRLIVIATLISTVFFSFIGYAHTLPLFVAFLLVGGIGVALYHPRAGALAVAVSGNRRALGMASSAPAARSASLSGTSAAPTCTTSPET